MKKFILLLFASVVIIACKSHKSESDVIKAFDIDFNWGDGGPNAFAEPGLWAEANPEEHIRWYDDLGCNVIQTFAVSCNGYAWYKNGVVPEQPGLKYDFLTDMVRLGHERGMKVFGYFCIGANTRWGLENPEESYGVPSAPHIPFTQKYLDYLSEAIQDAVIKTKIDGFMIDWLWNPGSTMQPYPPLKWLECEKQMFVELMGEPFPGVENITEQIEGVFRKKAIARCWKTIYDSAKRANPDCMIWVSCCEIESADLEGSYMFKQADIFMNEAGSVADVAKIRSKVGAHTTLMTCLANWNNQDPAQIIPEAQKEGIALYGFTKPQIGSMLMPVDNYLSESVDSFTSDDRNIAFFARFYNGLPQDYIK